MIKFRKSLLLYSSCCLSLVGEVYMKVYITEQKISVHEDINSSSVTEDIILYHSLWPQQIVLAQRESQPALTRL